jgi:FkbM family methyltransferase
MINSRAVREVLKVFQVHLLVDWLLRIFPRMGNFGGFAYPVRSLESLIVEKEIFKTGIYDGVFDLFGVETFVDLGCNRGFFSIWLASKAGNPPAGLLVEANPSLIPEVESLLARNNFRKMRVLNGAAGAGMEGGEVEILIPPTDVGAGLKATTAKSLAGDKCELVRVPALSVGDAWRKSFSVGERCGILKIDIEGAEGRFFEEEGDFLNIVDRLVVEVHEASVSLDEIRNRILMNGFVIRKESKEDSETALVFAERE